MKKRPIITEQVNLPIPIRNYDWKAYRKDWDLGEPIGYGATQNEAINHLKEIEG